MKIDRERLIKLHLELCKGSSCHRCSVKGLQRCAVHLMSNLLEQNPDLITDLPQNTEQIQLPVKTTWSLKPEYLPLYKSITGHVPQSDMTTIPDEIKPFYNAKTEPDYSKVPVGAVISISIVGSYYSNKRYGMVTYVDGNKIVVRNYDLHYDIMIDSIKSLTILKLPEGK